MPPAKSDQRTRVVASEPNYVERGFDDSLVGGGVHALREAAAGAVGYLGGEVAEAGVDGEVNRVGLALGDAGEGLGGALADEFPGALRGEHFAAGDADALLDGDGDDAFAEEGAGLGTRGLVARDHDDWDAVVAEDEGGLGDLAALAAVVPVAAAGLGGLCVGCPPLRGSRG